MTRGLRRPWSMAGRRGVFHPVQETLTYAAEEGVKKAVNEPLTAPKCKERVENFTGLETAARETGLAPW
jgi:hypothetical protein